MNTRTIEDEHILSGFSMIGFILLTFFTWATVAILYLEREAEERILRVRHDIRTAINFAEKTLRGIETDVNLGTVWAENSLKNLSDFTHQDISGFI